LSLAGEQAGRIAPVAGAGGTSRVDGNGVEGTPGVSQLNLRLADVLCICFDFWFSGLPQPPNLEILFVCSYGNLL
jgi:hypothetical protein